MASDQEAKAQRQTKRDQRDQEAEAKRGKKHPVVAVIVGADHGKSVTDMRAESNGFASNTIDILVKAIDCRETKRERSSRSKRSRSRERNRSRSRGRDYKRSRSRDRDRDNKAESKEEIVDPLISKVRFIFFKKNFLHEFLCRRRSKSA